MYVRANYDVRDHFSIVGGIENLLDHNYLEHLDLRLPPDVIDRQAFVASPVLSPGITPYIGFEWTH